MQKLLQMEGACVAFRFLRHADVRVVLIVPEAASEKTYTLQKKMTLRIFVCAFGRWRRRMIYVTSKMVLLAQSCTDRL